MLTPLVETQNLDGPIIDKRLGQVISIQGDNVQIMDMENYDTIDLPMPEDLKDQLLGVEFREGVAALKKLSDEHKSAKNNLGKILPADFFPVISKYNGNPYMVIASAKVIIGAHCIDNIFSVIENRLLDVLILLEQEFGNLDDLDLNTSTKTTDDIENIANKIIVIVYNDQSVRIGDNNKIKDSSLGAVINDTSNCT